MMAEMKATILPAALFSMVPFSVQAADIPWGIEAMAGYRTSLVHRGYDIADEVYDYQLELETALSQQWSLNFSAIYALGTGMGNDFSEKTGIVDLRYDATDWSAGWTMGYRDFTDTFIRDGWETGPFLTLRVNPDLELRGEFLYDRGADSYFGSAQFSWSKAFSTNSFINLRGGVSHVEDFYGSQGFHAADMRLSLTYRPISNVSLSPFIGGSMALDNRADDALFGGVWFAVTF